MDGLEKVFSNGILQAEKESRTRGGDGMLSGSDFHPLEGGEGFLYIFLEVLNEDDRLSFQQAIESIFSSIDFQKAVDDEDDENDSGEDPQIDG